MMKTRLTTVFCGGKVYFSWLLFILMCLLKPDVDGSVDAKCKKSSRERRRMLIKSNTGWKEESTEDEKMRQRGEERAEEDESRILGINPKT